MSEDLAEREREIVGVLGKLQGKDVLLVGGYAVSALAIHRFSIDCDLVVPSVATGVITLLEEEGYVLDHKKDGFDPAYGGRFERYTKKVGGNPVSVDLLVGSLVSRKTGASWSFEYMKKHSVAARIFSVECRVPEKELLAALKIHSARKTDIRDIVMLADGCDPRKVAEHLDRGDKETLRSHIHRVRDVLEDEKLVDSLKGVFGLRREVGLDIKKAKILMDRIGVSSEKRNGLNVVVSHQQLSSGRKIRPRVARGQAPEQDGGTY